MIRTLRAQLFLGSLATFVLMLGLLLWNAQSLMTLTLEQQFESEVDQVRPLLQAAIAPLMAARDYATLQSVVDESVSVKGLAYVEVQANGRVLARSRPGSAPSAREPLLVTQMDVAAAGQNLGQVSFGIRTDSLVKARASMQRNSLAIGGLVLVTGSLLLALGANWLTRGLRRVAQASERLAGGDMTVRLPDSAMLEVRQVSSAFNRMAQAVRDQLSDLQQRETLQRSMLDTLTEGLVVVGRDKKQALEFNGAALDIFGLGGDELITIDFSRYGIKLLTPQGEPFPDEQRPAFRALATGDTVRGVLIQIQRRDRSVIWAQVNSTPLWRPTEPEPYAAVTSLTDVTRHVLAEQQLRTVNTDLERRVRARTAELHEAKDAAEQANLAKSEFLSRMSHELRTPLNAILGFAQLLALPRDTLSEDDRRKAGQIESAGWHLLELIDDVLDLARIEAGTLSTSMEAVELRATVREAMALMQGQADAAGVTLVDVGADGAAPQWALGDRRRLKQVLHNLLSNAIKYNRPQGRVEVCVETPAQGRVQVRVIDTGRGFSAEQVKQLFQPFTRFVEAGEAIEGTGIGLVITRRLVELMGGRLSLSSTAGEGSSFSFDLASADAPQAVAQAPAAAPEPATAAGGPRRRVLYVEDNPSNVSLLREAIKLRRNYTLEVCTDGLSGLAQASAAPPHLILIDINLPGIDGVELCRRLRAQPSTRRLPLVAVSANAMPAEVARAKAAGFDAYLTKPLDVEKLLAEMDRLLA